jgi:hypothetical protein
MADVRALVIKSGTTQNIPAADSLLVGTGIDASAAGALTIGGTTATSITIGSAAITTDFPGPVQLTGDVTTVGGTTFTSDATFEGNVTFGNGPSDTVTFASTTTIINDIAFNGAGYRVTNMLDPTGPSTQEGATAAWVTSQIGALVTGVSAVSATAPLLSSGGATPDISIDTAGAASGDVLTFDGTSWSASPAAQAVFAGALTVYVDPVNGVDSPNGGTLNKPYASINYAYSQVTSLGNPTNTTYNAQVGQFVTEKLIFRLAPGRYTGDVTLGFKRARMQLIGDGVQIIGNVKLSAVRADFPAASMEALKASFPSPWTGVSAQMTFEITGEAGGGVEADTSADPFVVTGFSTLAFEESAFAGSGLGSNWDNNYGQFNFYANKANLIGGMLIATSYTIPTTNGLPTSVIEIDSCTIGEASSPIRTYLGAVPYAYLASPTTWSTGTVGTTNKAPTGIITLKCHSSTLGAAIGPRLTIGEIDGCRIYDIDRTMLGTVDNGAVTGSTSTSYIGMVINQFRVYSGAGIPVSQYQLGAATGTTRYKMDSTSYTTLAFSRSGSGVLTPRTLNLGGGVSFDFLDDSRSLAYTPTTPAQWLDPDPTTVGSALDKVGSLGLLSAAPANGQIPIGNGTNFTPAVLTAGTGISITNGAGSITINSTGGTVTGVTATAPLLSSGGATPDISLTGVVAVGNGGTGQSTLTSGAIVVGNGASAVNTLSPGSNGQVLTVVGGAWAAAAPVATPPGGPTDSVQLNDGAGNFIGYSALSWNNATSSFSADGSAVFNESGANRDFRVEAVGNANMLFVDASQASVSIGTTGATHTFNIGTGAAANFCVASGGRIHTYDGSSPTNGQILIGDTAAGNFAKAAISAGTNIAITNGAGSISIDLTGQVAVGNGGTGQSTLTSGALVVGNGASAVNTLSPGSNGQVLTVVGGAWAASSLPAATDYSVVSITTAVAQGDAVTVAGAAAIATAAASARVAGMVSATANKVSVLGIIEDCNFEGSLTLAAGEAVYLSAASAGKLTNVAPSASGEVVAELGIIVTVNAAGGGAAAADVLWQPKSIVVL